MSREDFFFGIALLAVSVALGLIGVATVVPRVVAPAWVEAFGTVTAVFAAIAVPVISRYLERKDRQDERYQQSLRFTYTLIPPMDILYGDLKRANLAINDLERTPQLSKEIVLRLEDARLNIPEELNFAVTQMHLLDSRVVGPSHVCIGAAKAYNGDVDVCAR